MTDLPCALQRSSAGSVDGKASQRVTAGSNKKRTKSQAGANGPSERTSIAQPHGDDQPGVPDSEEKSSRSKTRRESENPLDRNRRESANTNRRESGAESQHSLQANCEAAAVSQRASKITHCADWCAVPTALYYSRSQLEGSRREVYRSRLDR